MALGVPCKKNAVFATGTFNVLISSIGDVPSLTAQCNANQNAARKCGVFALVGVRRELAHVRMPAGAKSVA